MSLGLESWMPSVLYVLAVMSFLLSIFWKPIVGIIYLLPLIPLQTIRYRTNDFPLGESLVGAILLGVALGVLRTRNPDSPKLPWLGLVAIYGTFTYVSLCLGSFYLDRSLPLPGDARFAVWREYMVMPVLLLLTVAVAQTKRQMQFIIVLLCISTLATDKSFWSTVSGREFTAYSDELHVEGGSMGYAGTNGLAAFTAQVATFLLALGTYERRAWARISYYGLAAFSAICLMFSLSRGGYAAFVAGCVVIGLLRQRMLLVLLVIFFLTWTTFVPSAVQERVEMTYDKQSGSLDNSSAIRLSLWNNAIEVFKSNMWLGTGFNTYEYMHLNKRSDGVYYADTHNYFIKVLVETGIVGMAMFLWVLARMFREGGDLFRHATDPFFASLGLGAIGWLVCSLVANTFGDRWTFLQVNGYMWVIAGLVCRATQLEKEANVSLPPSAGPIEAATFESPELTLHHA